MAHTLGDAQRPWNDVWRANFSCDTRGCGVYGEITGPKEDVRVLVEAVRAAHQKQHEEVA